MREGRGEGEEGGEIEEIITEELERKSGTWNKLDVEARENGNARNSISRN